MITSARSSEKNELERVSRREREYLIHREEILQAAEKVFAAKGSFTAR